jgi:hypothetical protein
MLVDGAKECDGRYLCASKGWRDALEVRSRGCKNFLCTHAMRAYLPVILSNWTCRPLTVNTIYIICMPDVSLYISVYLSVGYGMYDSRVPSTNLQQSISATSHSSTLTFAFIPVVYCTSISCIFVDGTVDNNNNNSSSRLLSCVEKLYLLDHVEALLPQCQDCYETRTQGRVHPSN